MPLLSRIYPGDNTKVTNPNIVFHWERKNWGIPPRKYRLEIFEGMVRKRWPQIIRITWRKIISIELNGTSCLRSLRPGKHYISIVTPIMYDFQRPIRIEPNPVTINLLTGTRTDRIPPEIRELPLHLRPIVSKFYVKESEGYLNSYLELRSEEVKLEEQRLKPIIPLLFFQLDRYLTPDTDRTYLDDAFARSMEDRPDEFKSPYKLKKLLEVYESVPEETKRKFSGRTLNSLPTNRSDIQWAEKALDELFSDSVLLTKLRESGKQQKTMDFSFKYPPISGSDCPLGKGYFEIKVPKDMLHRQPPQYQLDLTKSYYLRILAYTYPPNIEIATVLLEIEETANEYILRPADPEGGTYDSARFRAQLWEVGANQFHWNGGELNIKGGEPIIIMVKPTSKKQGDRDTAVKLDVRDAGDPNQDPKIKLVLKHPSGQPKYEIPSFDGLRVLPGEQTLHHQVFEFKLSDYQPPSPAPQSQVIDAGIYTLSFKTDTEYVSDVTFLVEQDEYEVRVRELKCLNESNPEWWGDDTISFQTFVNTKFFVQDPKQSKKYDGYHKNVSRYSYQSPRLRDKDVCIYGPDGARVIEDFLSINVAIYEHDDLAWLAWVIDTIIDFVQSFLAHLIDVFTFGVGGYIVEAGLEVSGLNDMREQAIDSMVAGWEVEVLHQGSLALIPQDMPLGTNTWDREKTFPGKESRYQIRFQMLLNP